MKDNSKATVKDYTAVPKADLHVHLNGLVSTSVFKKLLSQLTAELPEWFDLDKNLQVNQGASSLEEYLLPWHGFKLLPRTKAQLFEMTESAIGNLSKDEIRYAEIRNSPFNIAELNRISLESALHWLCDAVQAGNEKYKIDTRLIISLSRYKLTYEKAQNLLNAIGKVARFTEIVGIDISGNEDETIPDGVANLIRRAKDSYGVGVTIHAGETGTARNVTWAIEACHADRIGHGCVIGGSPELIETVLRNNTCIEVCLYSNLLSGAVKSIDAHPVVEFKKWGVPFVICTDNPIVHMKSLSDEYQLFSRLIGSGSQQFVDQMYSRQLEFRFGGPTQ